MQEKQFWNYAHPGFHFNIHDRNPITKANANSTKDKNMMKSKVQLLAERTNMSCEEFIGEMRKRGCSEPTALKLWRGEYEKFEDFKDNDINLSSLRKAAFVLKVEPGTLLPHSIAILEEQA